MFSNKRIIIYFIFSSTLFFGFLLKENSSGGAKVDYEYLLTFIKNFSLNFRIGLDLFVNEEGSLIHSPVFYILAGFFLKISKSILFVKFLYILISCLLPYVFYLIIKTKYKVQTDYVFVFSLIIFLSPYFRSSAIWLLGDNLSLLFFSLSILFYLKIRDEKEKILNYYLCFIFLILCCYIRYYYCIFSIYFLIIFYKNLNFKYFLKILIIGFILTIPAIFYLYYVTGNSNFIGRLSGYSQINYYSNSLIILSILLFYLFPFIFTKNFLIFQFYKKNYKNLLIIFCPIFILYFLDNFFFYDLINFSRYGGGVFLKISNIINFDSNLFLSITTFISLILIDYFFKDNRLENYILLIILILCFPIFTIYQKYFDPLFYLLFFGLINSIHFKDMILNKSITLSLVYGYFLLFFLFSVFYYSQGA